MESTFICELNKIAQMLSGILKINHFSNFKFQISNLKIIVIMASITFNNGERVYYNNYSKFYVALEVLQNAGVKYVNYYSENGEPHVVCYEITPDGRALVDGELISYQKPMTLWYGEK